MSLEQIGRTMGRSLRLGNYFIYATFSGFRCSTFYNAELAPGTPEHSQSQSQAKRVI